MAQGKRQETIGLHNQAIDPTAAAGTDRGGGVSVQAHPRLIATLYLDDEKYLSSIDRCHQIQKIFLIWFLILLQGIRSYCQKLIAQMN